MSNVTGVVHFATKYSDALIFSISFCIYPKIRHVLTCCIMYTYVGKWYGIWIIYSKICEHEKWEKKITINTHGQQHYRGTCLLFSGFSLPRFSHLILILILIRSYPFISSHAYHTWSFIYFFSNQNMITLRFSYFKIMLETVYKNHTENVDDNAKTQHLQHTGPKLF